MSLAEENLDHPQSSVRKWAVRLVVVVALGLLVAGLVYLLQGLGSGKSGPRKQVTRINIMPDTPPPPPPPPKEEKKIEQRESKEVKEAQAPKPAPEMQALKMEGEAGDKGGPIGGGTVSKDYTEGEPKTGPQTIGGGGQATGLSKLAKAMFAQQVERHFQEYVNRHQKIRGRDYRVPIKVVFDDDGRVERVEVSGSTGDKALDGDLDEVLRSAPPLKVQVPQSIRHVVIRITNRVTS